MQKEELFKLYDSELALRLHNAKNLSDTRKILTRFLLEYLNGFLFWGLPPDAFYL